MVLEAAVMQSDSPQQFYNIGMVSHLTGISVATLRVWERRYGFPLAGRSEGGHRLYSEKDVSDLHWIKSQIDRGLQTSQAVRARRMELSADPQGSLAQAGGDDPGSLAVLQSRLFDSLRHYDTAQADRILADGLLAYPLDRLVFEVVRPVLESIGEGWQDRRLSVAVEHFMTNHLRQRLMLWMHNGPPPYAVRPLILACAPDEWHEGGLLMLGGMLRRRRWPIAYLGQAVPLPDLAGIVKDLMPPAVVVVAMTEAAAASLVSWPAHLPGIAGGGEPLFGFGGRIFTQDPAWQSRMPGRYLGDTLAEGVDLLDDYLQHQVGLVR
jgi:MerR family transcriptional regulator, light-induced transcriptional regulator